MTGRPAWMVKNEATARLEAQLEEAREFNRAQGCTRNSLEDALARWHAGRDQQPEPRTADRSESRRGATDGR